MKKRRWNPRRRTVMMLALAAAPQLLLEHSFASNNKTYIAVNSDWNNANNWSPAIVPVAGTNSNTPGDNVNFSGGSSHTCLYDDNYTSTGPLGTLTIDDTGVFTNTLSMQTPADTLTLDGLVQVGVNGSGQVIHTAGTTNIVNSNSLYIGVNATGIGAYTLGNGTSTPSLVVAGNEEIGSAGIGTFTQNSGAHIIAGVFYTGFNGGSGTFNLSGGNLNVAGTDAFRASELVGDIGTGLFNQSGGINTVGAAGPADLDIGGAYSTFNANGTYFLSNSATLNVTGSEYIGLGTGAAVTSGTFNQSGGTHTVGYQLIVGGNTYGTSLNSNGTYILSNNGALLVNSAGNTLGDSTGYLGAVGEYIGSIGGTAKFIQSGGSNTIGSAGTTATGENLYVGFGYSLAGYTGSVGSYLMNGSSASLTTYGSENVGYFGVGSFTQTAGTNTIGTNTSNQFLNIGEGTSPNGRAVGTYLLNGAATLTVNGSEDIGYNASGNGSLVPYAGTLNQSAGLHTVTGTLNIGVNAGDTGQFILSGGNVSAGTVLTITGPISNQVVAGSNSYIGNSGYGVFNQTGGTFTYGASIAAYGAANATPGNLVVGNNNTATGSYTLSGNGSIVGYGDEVVASSAAGSAGAPGGQFTQNTGTSNLLAGAVYLGQSNGSFGLYTMNGGTLQSSGAYIGNSGVGVFNQNGGNATFGFTYSVPVPGFVSIDQSFWLGVYAAASGSYNLSGAGSLTVNDQAFIGYGGIGTVNQTSASSSANFSSGLYLGLTDSYLVNSSAVNASGTGTYNLSAGMLTAVSEVIGDSGTGSFIQSGGTNTIGTSVSPGTLDVGASNTGSGSYVLSPGGQLVVNGQEIIGYEGSGLSNSPNGVFTQYNGSTHTVTGLLYLGQQDPQAPPGGQATYLRSIGQYSLNGGSLSAAGEVVGFAGTGIFNQSGGTNTVGSAATPGTLDFGGSAGGTGIYTISSSGATLVVNGSEIVGDASTASGTFNQSAGVQTITSSLILGNSGGATGTFNLTGGNLNGSGGEIIGNAGTGILVQSGTGSNIVGTGASNQNLYIGYNGGAGSYTLNGNSATLVVNGNAYVGGTNSSAGGIGVLSISAGSATVTGTLKAWNETGTSIVLTGGVLSIGALDLGSNPSLLNWTGGTLNFLPAAIVNSNFVLGSSVTLSGTMLLSSSSSLTDNGQITLVGGGLSGTGPIINNALITGYGSINGSGGFTNNAELSQGAGNLTVANTGINSNTASIDLSAGHSFILQSANLTNTGTLNVNGAIISGTGTLINTTGGTVAGKGTIAAAFTNATGATLIAQGGTLSVPAFNNAGAALVTAGSTLTGGLLTNSGRIGGTGTISNAISNTGTIEAVGGILTLLGSLTNTTTGIIYADPASDTIASAFPTSAATIELDGGTFETSGQTLSNSGNITGYGRLRTGGLTNTGTILFAGGSATLDGALTNNAAVIVQNTPALFTGLVTNNGTFRVISGGSATFANGYTGGSVSNFAVINTGTFSLSNALIAEGNFTNSGSFNVSGTQTWSPASTFTNTAGSASFSTDAGGGGTNLTVLDTSGNVGFSSTQHLAGLNISTGATTTLTGGGSGHRSLLYTTSLAITGTLDLTANDLDVQAGSLAAVRAMVIQGYNNGRWSGTGITSSSAAGDTTHLTALGVIQSIGTSLDGLPVAIGDVLVKYTYYGDTNLDGKVDGSDYSRIDGAYLADKSNPTAYTGWFNGDFNYDGVINGSDYTLIDNAFNTQGVAVTAEVSGLTAIETAQIANLPGDASVPEPTALSGAAMIGIWHLRRRRRPASIIP